MNAEEYKNLFTNVVSAYARFGIEHAVKIVRETFPNMTRIDALDYVMDIIAWRS